MPSSRFSVFGTAPESPPDDRDHLADRYLVQRATSALPDEVGIKHLSLVPFIRNQWFEGSCTGQGAAAVKDVVERRTRKSWARRRVPVFGARGIYYLAKEAGGYPDEEGAYMRDVAKAMATFGVPREKDWPYQASWDDKGPQSIGEPSSRWLTNARRWRIGAYARCTNIDQVLLSLHEIGPVFMAMTLHTSFMDPGPTGEIPSPTASEKEEGGHAMAFLAAQRSRRRFLTLNSWGKEWGNGGVCWISFDHFAGVRGEAWTIPDV